MLDLTPPASPSQGVDAAFMLFWRQGAQPTSIVVGRRCVSWTRLLVLLRSWHAAVTCDTRLRRSVVAAPPGSYLAHTT
jgi:hypothetical protein